MSRHVRSNESVWPRQPRTRSANEWQPGSISRLLTFPPQALKARACLLSVPPPAAFPVPSSSPSSVPAPVVPPAPVPVPAPAPAPAPVAGGVAGVVAGADALTAPLAIWKAIIPPNGPAALLFAIFKRHTPCWPLTSPVQVVPAGTVKATLKSWLTFVARFWMTPAPSSRERTYDFLVMLRGQLPFLPGTSAVVSARVPSAKAPVAVGSTTAFTEPQPSEVTTWKTPVIWEFTCGRAPPPESSCGVVPSAAWDREGGWLIYFALLADVPVLARPWRRCSCHRPPSFPGHWFGCRSCRRQWCRLRSGND